MVYNAYMDIIQNQSSGQNKINFFNESDYAKTTPVNNENKTLHLGADKKSEPDFTFDKKTNNIDFENGNAENLKEENTAVEGGEKQTNKDINSSIQEGQEKQVQSQTTSQVGQEREQEKGDQPNEKPQNPIKPRSMEANMKRVMKMKFHITRQCLECFQSNADLLEDLRGQENISFLMKSKQTLSR